MPSAAGGGAADPRAPLSGVPWSGVPWSGVPWSGWPLSGVSLSRALLFRAPASGTPDSWASRRWASRRWASRRWVPCRWVHVHARHPARPGGRKRHAVPPHAAPGVAGRLRRSGRLVQPAGVGGPSRRWGWPATTGVRSLGARPTPVFPWSRRNTCREILTFARISRGRDWAWAPPSPKLAEACRQRTVQWKPTCWSWRMRRWC